MSRSFGIPGLVTILLVVGACSPDRGPEYDKSDLYGTYQIVKGEKDGLLFPEERMSNASVRIAENALTAYDKDNNEIYAATYELDTSREPWRLTMTATITPEGRNGEKTQGLIKIDEDNVTLIYALPGGAAPAEFSTRENQHMFVLRKLDR